MNEEKDPSGKKRSGRDRRKLFEEPPGNEQISECYTTNDSIERCVQISKQHAITLKRGSLAIDVGKKSIATFRLDSLPAKTGHGVSSRHFVIRCPARLKADSGLASIAPQILPQKAYTDHTQAGQEKPYSPPSLDTYFPKKSIPIETRRPPCYFVSCFHPTDIKPTTLKRGCHGLNQDPISQERGRVLFSNRTVSVIWKQDPKTTLSGNHIYRSYVIKITDYPIHN